MDTIYEVPLALEAQNLAGVVLDDAKDAAGQHRKDQKNRVGL